MSPRMERGLDVTVVIPTLNEAGSIRAVVSELRQHGYDRIIVADGSSRDGTRDRAEEAGARAIDVGRGYGRACRMGAEAARTEFVVFMDGDGADDPAFIENLVQPIRGGVADFTIGSRVRGRRERGSISLHQVAAGLVLGRIAGWLYGVRYTDMCAFRAIRREVLLALPMREMTYGWNLELQLRAARDGLRVVELPVDYRRRTAGQSNVSGSLAGSVRAGRQILATLARFAAEPRAG